jgi:hypothetical protein
MTVKKLSAIGSKYDPLLNDVNSKLSANTQAFNNTINRTS